MEVAQTGEPAAIASRQPATIVSGERTPGVAQLH
jgi:hypothetical protein